jgi:hypothetical protein
VIKTQAAKLFEGLCDNIDGAVTVTSYFCIQAINMTLSRESPKAMVELENFAANIDDAHRNLIENCSFIKNSKPDVIVESGIVVLALLSYVHSKQAYSTIFTSIEKVFTHFIDEIINNDSKLIRVRYSLFLGYLIDVLFKKEPTAFRDTILFLYTTVDLVGDDKAIACQSIDTLKTVVCDNDLQPRVIELDLIPVLIEKIQGSIATIQNHEYMDFVNDFLASYSQLIDDKAVFLAQAVVQRIRVEMAKGAQGTDGSTLLVQKMFNILKQLTQNKYLMTKYSESYEEAYKPIFEFMVDPSKISFEDDILNILKNFVRKTGKVSDVIYTVLPCLEQVFNKNKKCLGSTLLDTLNYYMIYGKERLMQDKGAVAMLTRLAVEAMFSVEPNITVVNAEGAIFLQIVFQIFQGTDVLNEYFEPVLDKVLERLKGAT